MNTFRLKPAQSCQRLPSVDDTQSTVKCPYCGSTEGIPIQYGMPTQATQERARRGEIWLGGCCMRADYFHCKNCGQNSCGEVEREGPLKRLKRWYRYWNPTSLT